MASHLFVLCPPFSGSTVLWQLLGTSPATSLLPDEGQFVAGAREQLRRDPWNESVVIDWPRVRSVWREHWDLSAPLLVEKSPPNLIRAEAIARHFAPLRFVIMVRGPFTHAESLMRRWQLPADAAARFVVECLARQHRNRVRFPASVVLTYEHLVADPVAVAAGLTSAIPALGRLDTNAAFTVHTPHGIDTGPITSFDDDKIDRLRSADVAALEAVFSEFAWVLERWDYSPGLTR